MAEKSASNLIKGILSSKEIPFERVLYAIGVRHVGETVAKKLATHFKSIENLINATFDDLILVDEIGDKIANSLVDFFNDPCNMKMIDRLKNIGLNFINWLESRKAQNIIKNYGFESIYSEENY